MSRIQLCTLNDIADGESAGFQVMEDEARHDLIAIRQGQSVYVYRNSCPHQGDMLDYPPGQCMDDTKSHILCAVHMALFRIEDGVCIDGPCYGEGLTAVGTTVDGNAVFIDL
jgi:nitrite reductase/ring-hydroxylating ferredoxin subunit